MDVEAVPDATLAVVGRPVEVAAAWCAACPDARGEARLLVESPPARPGPRSLWWLVCPRLGRTRGVSRRAGESVAEMSARCAAALQDGGS